ncbi:hypothetical protein JCM6882_001544 [Rhodosporidiobolus microsporus]
MAKQVKKSRSSTSSSSSPRHAVETPSGPDRLTELPPELLDTIFSLFPAGKAPRVPICKALLPFQRRRYIELRIPGTIKPEHAKALLSEASKLKRLTLVPSADVPTWIAALSRPEQLQHLRISKPSVASWKVKKDQSADAVFDGDVASSIASLSGLTTLQLNCPLDLSDAALITALRQTRLEVLELEEETADTIRAADLTPLVSGASKLPFLIKLSLHFTSGEAGNPASECHVRKSWHFYDTWELPTWPAHFTRIDLESLLKVSDVEVEGTAVEAILVEDEYEEERGEYEKMVEEDEGVDRRDRWGYYDEEDAEGE